MDRRAYLRRAVVVGGISGVTGCLGTMNNQAENPSNTPSETASNTESTPTINGDPPARFRSVTLSKVNTDRVPKNHKVAVGVDILIENITEQHSARIRPVFLNTGPKREFDGFGLDAPFDPSTRSEPQGWFLLPPSSRRGRASKHCWMIEEIPDWGGGTRNVRLQSGEAVTQNLELWSDPQVDKCLPTGEYLFQASYSMDDESTQKHTWSFTLKIDEAE